MSDREWQDELLAQIDSAPESKIEWILDVESPEGLFGEYQLFVSNVRFGDGVIKVTFGL